MLGVARFKAQLHTRETTPVKPYLTADGSYTFFSDTFGESFHSYSGARQEALGKFVAPTRLTDCATQASSLCLLDVCYGLGYNTAAALEMIWQVNPSCHVLVWALELEAAVPLAAVAQGWLSSWPQSIETPLATLAATHQVQTPTLEAHLILGDARQTLSALVNQGIQAQGIFLDPFSPPRCPQLWTVEFFQLLRRCLAPQGRLATYSCAAAVRAGLIEAGFWVTESPPVGRRSPGTVAALTQSEVLPLSLQAQEHLQTRAAVPYRDATGQDAAAEIVQRRQQEQQNSPLASTQAWKKRWLGNSSASPST
ncbi:hypothetical protein GS597_01560 [Synechococcales cyanobacterium C]|uniref:MnmC-like methyltransferase domain-containing protein n=2 Tax=Petrachloros TaxID=2918834 RepID=A0A8K2A6J8_9CYAN|nr:hypothetical protein [Petrachloros mirabilis ULC683]